MRTNCTPLVADLFLLFFGYEGDFMKSLSRENQSDINEAFRVDLNLCISNGTVSTKMYDKRDSFDFDTVNFPFLDGDAPGVPHMEYTYLNLLDSPELLQILVTLTAVKKP